MNIIENQLYIKQILRATESTLSRRYIPFAKPHHRDTFSYTISGTAVYTMEDGTQFQKGPGDIVYLARGKDYSLEVISDEYRYLLCDFHFDSDAPRDCMHFRLKNPSTFEHLFRKLTTTFSVSAPDQKIRCMSILYEIYSQLIKNETDQYIPGSAKIRITQAHSHIQSSVSDRELSVANLAKNAQMSEVHFRKLFSEMYGITPSRCILQERVAYAKTLMALGELQLEDIALQAGFCSLPHFCRVFKNITGLTPTAYRQKLPEF